MRDLTGWYADMKRVRERLVNSWVEYTVVEVDDPAPPCGERCAEEEERQRMSEEDSPGAGVVAGEERRRLLEEDKVGPDVRAGRLAELLSSEDTACSPDVHIHRQCQSVLGYILTVKTINGKEFGVRVRFGETVREVKATIAADLRRCYTPAVPGCVPSILGAQFTVLHNNRPLADSHVFTASSSCEEVCLVRGQNGGNGEDDDQGWAATDEELAVYGKEAFDVGEWESFYIFVCVHMRSCPSRTILNTGNR